MSDVDVMQLLALSEQAAQRKRARWVPQVKVKAGACPWLIRCWREWCGFSQRELATACGIGPRDTTLSLIESYKWPVTAERLESLASGLGVKPEQLCTKTDDEAQANAQLFDEWTRAGRPNLRKWLRERKLG